MDTRTTGHFIVGTGQMGAVTFRGTLTFTKGHVAGVGTLTQPISPPLDLELGLTGTVSTLVFGGIVTESIHLTGRGHPAGLPMPPYPVDLTCAMLIDSGAPGQREALASLSYVGHDGQWTKLDNVPLKMTWQRAPD